MEKFILKKCNLMWYVLGIIIPVILISFDQFVKHLAKTHLAPVGNINLIDGIFELCFSENDGAAFGLFSGHQWLLIPVSAIIIGVLVFFYIKTPQVGGKSLLRVSIILIVSGAVGNFIDRVISQKVVDLFYFKLIDFPIFNVADIYVVCGTILLAFTMLFFPEPNKKQELI